MRFDRNTLVYQLVLLELQYFQSFLQIKTEIHHLNQQKRVFGPSLSQITDTRMEKGCLAVLLALV